MSQRLASGIRTSDESHNQRDGQQGNHAIGCNGEAFAVLAIDKGEDKSPKSRQTTYDEEHQSLSTGTELGREQL